MEPGDEVDDLYAGLYRSHNPWSQAARLVRVDGSAGDAAARHRHEPRPGRGSTASARAIARGPIPEYLAFDLEVEGRMQRFEWNGLPYYRAI